MSVEWQHLREGAWANLQAGRWAEAEQSCRQLLEHCPEDHAMWHLLAAAELRQGHLDSAATHLDRALGLCDASAEYQITRGLIHRAMGQLEQACRCYEKARLLDPQNSNAWFNSGNVCQLLGRFDEAIGHYRQSIVTQPQSPDAYFNLGILWQGLGQLTKATEAFEAALRQKPDYAEAFSNLAAVCNQMGAHDRAARLSQQAITLRPDFGEAWINLGNAFEARGQHEPARDSYAQAIRLRPDDFAGYLHLGRCLQRQGAATESMAEDCYRHALRLAPRQAGAHNNLGALLHDQGRFAEALDCFKQALHHDPDLAEAHVNQGMLFLLRGDFLPGWPEFEWRWRWRELNPAPRDFTRPAWRGEELPGGTVLLFPEQGFGDTLQFVRYAALVKQRCQRVIVQCQPALAGLLATANGADQILPEGQPLPPYDAQVSMMSLPGIFRATAESIPGKIPYLRVPDGTAAPVLPREGPPRIGLAWAGNPRYLRDRQRSMSWAQLIPLLAVEGVSFFSLQVGPKSSEIAASQAASRITDLSAQLTDFCVTAAVIQQLDLVITTDTAVAHLAGALGQRVWTMLSYVPDWRWLLDREDCPWYPTMRLYRQTRANDWDAVLRRVAGDLARWRESLATGTSATRIPAPDLSVAATPASGDAARPIPVATLIRQAMLHQQQGDLAKTIQCFQEVVRRQPEDPEAHFNLGLALHQSGALMEALDAYRQALHRRPAFRSAWQNLGSVQHQLGQLVEARESLGRALALDDQQSEVWNNLGTVYQAGGDYAEAIKKFEQALVLRPNYLEAALNRAIALRENGCVAEALIAHERVLAAHPQDAEAHWNYGFTLLLAGDFTRGWPEYEWRLRLPQVVRTRTHFSQPLWQGEDLAGRTFLVCGEQGLGDTLQFVRFLPLLAEAGATIHLECQPELLALLKTVRGVASVIPRGETPPPFDFQVPLLSLPAMLRKRGESFAARIPYLSAPKPTTLTLPPHPAGRLRVGLVWAGNPRHKNDRHRSMAWEQLGPLLAEPVVLFVSLQTGKRADDLAHGAEAEGVVNWGARLGDFAETAAAVEALDLVITVDTAVAHLAGALGKSVWLLLPFAPDWRWFLRREDSPWYPSMRLFRQSAPNDWAAVILRVRQALSDWRVDRAGQAASDRSPKAVLGAAPAPEGQEANGFFQQALHLHRQGHLTEAVRHYQKALALCPHWMEAMLNLGQAWAALGRLEEAEQVMLQAAQWRPDFPGVHLTLGSWLKKRGRLAEAAACCQREIQYHPDDPHAYYNLGLIRHTQHEYESAVECYDHVVRLKNDYLDAWNHLGLCYQQMGDLPKALQHYERAIRCDPAHPEPHWNKATALLLQGDWPPGWEEHEWRWRLPDFTTPEWPTNQPRWRGEPLAGKTILLHAEQGAGDTIQFVRYATEVARLGGQVLVGCAPSLRRLVSTVRGVDAVVTHRKDLPALDYQAPLLSLPRLFGTTPREVPDNCPYVFPPPLDKKLPLLSAAGGLKVGLVWAGNPGHRNDRQRSIPLAKWGSVWRVEGVRFFSLQMGPQRAEMADSQVSVKILDLAAEGRDFLDTAQVMQALDLVIAVDTAAAHLAGALGIAVWVLLPLAPDWRWLLGRDTSPWYPTMRLFRQTERGHWETVMDRVAAALRELARSRL